MKEIFLFLLVCSPCFGQWGPVPQQAGFRIVETGPPFSRLLVEDIDGDGFSEIVTLKGEAIGNTTVHVYEHTGLPKIGWPMATGMLANVAMSSGDIDGDGFLELAWGALFSPFGRTTIQVADHDGNLMQDFMDGMPLVDPISPLVFADLNGDGADELIFLDSDGYPEVGVFHAISVTGQNIEGWPVEIDLEGWPNTFQNPLFIRDLSAGDFNYDNSYHLIFGTGRLHDLSMPGPVFRIGGNGLPIAGYPRIESNIHSCTSILIADFNRDKSCDYGGVGRNRFLVRRNDGSNVISLFLPFGAEQGTKSAIGQFDLDEELEVLFLTEHNRIIDPRSEAGFEHIGQDNPGLRFLEPCVADIDGDGISEIGGILRDGRYSFAVADHELNILPGWPVDLSSSITHSYPPTCVADLDNDGDLEMIVVVPEAIYAFDFDTPAGKIYWSGLHGNSARNRFPDHRNYPNEAFVRGDLNSDSVVDISDLVLFLQHQFFGELHTKCKPRLDVDGSEQVDLTDLFAMMNALFLGESSIPLPYPECAPMPKASRRELYCLESNCL